MLNKGPEYPRIHLLVKTTTPKNSNLNSLIAIEWNSRKKVFKYRNLFNNPKNEVIYNQAVSIKVEYAVSGYNNTIITYGLRKSGKTRLLMSNLNYSITDLFQLQKDSNEFDILFSSYEVLGSAVFDLLKDSKLSKLNKLTSCPGSPERKEIPIAVIYDCSQTSFRELKNIKRVKLNSEALAKDVIKSALATKIKGSHAFFVFYIVQKDSRTVSKLQFVDLNSRIDMKNKVAVSLDKQTIIMQNIGVSYFEQLFSAKSSLFGTRQSLITNLLRDIFLLNSTTLQILCCIDFSNNFKDSELQTIFDCTSNIESLCRKQKSLQPLALNKRVISNSERYEENFENALQQYFRSVSVPFLEETRKDKLRNLEDCLSQIQQNCCAELSKRKNEVYDLVLKVANQMLERKIEQNNQILIGVEVPENSSVDENNCTSSLENSKNQRNTEPLVEGVQKRPSSYVMTLNPETYSPIVFSQEQLVNDSITEEDERKENLEIIKLTLRKLTLEIKKLSQEISLAKQMGEAFDEKKKKLLIKKNTFREKFSVLEKQQKTNP